MRGVDHALVLGTCDTQAHGFWERQPQWASAFYLMLSAVILPLLLLLTICMMADLTCSTNVAVIVSLYLRILSSWGCGCGMC